jgi:type I restriction-modification system DNA methylase subunit
MALLLANGSMSSNSSGEGEIRRALIEADLVECMVALPGNLFTNTTIPACIWFLTKNKAADAKRGFRDRRKQTLFIDARKLGTLRGCLFDRYRQRFVPEELSEIHQQLNLCPKPPFKPCSQPLSQIKLRSENSLSIAKRSSQNKL